MRTVAAAGAAAAPGSLPAPSQQQQHAAPSPGAYLLHQQPSVLPGMQRLPPELEQQLLRQTVASIGARGAAAMQLPPSVALSGVSTSQAPTTALLSAATAAAAAAATATAAAVGQPGLLAPARLQ
jgi:hypothetical protein